MTKQNSNTQQIMHLFYISPSKTTPNIAQLTRRFSNIADTTASHTIT